jgi:hypothetical protein
MMSGRRRAYTFQTWPLSQADDGGGGGDKEQSLETDHRRHAGKDGQREAISSELRLR